MIELDIKILELYSDIKAHTIRMWEHRFRLFQPSRTPGNKRIYGLNDLKLILDYTVLLKHGYSISKIVNLAPAVLQSKITLLNTTTAAQETTINRLIIAYVESDIPSFEDTLSTYSLSQGIHQCVEEIIIPFISRVGLFYYVDQKPSTHFVVTALRRKVLHATESLNESDATQVSALLFLPPNQHFDLLLLCVSYQLKTAGVHVFYLGTNVGSEILETVIVKYRPDFLVSYISSELKACRTEKVFFSNLSVLHKNLLVTAANSKSASLFDFAIPFQKLTQHIGLSGK